MNQKKIAIINSVFDYGSTGLLARQLYEYGNNNGFDTYAFYGRGKKYSDTKIIKIDTNIEFLAHKGLTLLTGMQGSFSNIATSKLLSYFERIDIHYAIFLNLHGYYLNEKRLFEYCRKHDIKIAYIMPDEYAGLGKCVYCGDCKKFQSLCDKCPQIHLYPQSLLFDSSKKIFINKMEEYKGQNITFAAPRSNIAHLEGSKLLEQQKILELILPNAKAYYMN